MLKFDKNTALKTISPKVSSTFEVLKVELNHYEVLLADITQDPQLKVWVTLTEEYIIPAMEWEKGEIINATLRSEIFTIGEKVKKMGWDTEICENELKESGYDWDSALANYFFDGKIEKIIT
ncbi:MAG: hypothetical protein D3923_04690 [Candidatus Electrothrix sp. AR3]|nr:hypothetical protein [Candidatus Electrothrix sp. AR3]